MKLPKAKFSKKIAVIVVSIVVITSGTAVLAYNQNSSSKPTNVATVAATPAGEAAKEVAEVKTEPVVAPVEAPKPVPQPVAVKQPAGPTSEELKAYARAAVINFAESQGMKGGTGIGAPEGQWVCMEKFLVRDSVAPENYMAYINKNMIVGDHDPNREGNQRYFFNGAGTCGPMVYTR